VMITGSVVILGAIWFAFRLPSIRMQIRPIYQAMGILPPSLEQAVETAAGSPS
jgi:predicted membrane-bound mannosyltransferase